MIWEGRTEHDAASLLAENVSHCQRNAKAEATEWLRELLNDGPVAAAEVTAQAERARNFGDDAAQVGGGPQHLEEEAGETRAAWGVVLVTFRGHRMIVASERSLGASKLLNAQRLSPFDRAGRDCAHCLQDAHFCLFERLRRPSVRPSGSQAWGGELPPSSCSAASCIDQMAEQQPRFDPDFATRPWL